MSVNIIRKIKMAGHLRKKELVYIDECYWLKPGLDLEFRTNKN